MTTLNQFVTVQLSPEALVNATDHLQHYREQVRAEKRQITRQLLEISYATLGAAEREAAIQPLQVDIMRLLDTLYYYRISHQAASEGAQTPDELTLFYGEVEDMLQEILIGLEQHFPECLSPDLPLPFSYAVRAREQLWVRLTELEVLLSRQELDGTLQELVFRPVKDFLLNTEERLNFRALAYIRELLSQLYITGTLKMVPPDKFHLQVHSILLHLNFNAIEYYLYCISRLRAWLKGYPHLRGRIACLTWFIKEVKSIPLKGREVALYPSGSPIAGQLYAWMEEERIFLQNVYEESIGQPALFQRRKENEGTADALAEKLQTNLTVSQLALMLRIYIEEGIIKCTSLQQVLFFMTGFMKVRKPGTIGEESFEVKYYNPSLSTITACKSWLSRLTERLNDHEKKMRAYID